jgi:hypothetical protein
MQTQPNLRRRAGTIIPQSSAKPTPAQNPPKMARAKNPGRTDIVVKSRTASSLISSHNLPTLSLAKGTSGNNADYLGCFLLKIFDKPRDYLVELHLVRGSLFRGVM